MPCLLLHEKYECLLSQQTPVSQHPIANQCLPSPFWEGARYGVIGTGCLKKYFPYANTKGTPTKAHPSPWRVYPACLANSGFCTS
jgi:hypothetical protein